MNATTPVFSLLIKPAGADCNQRCVYCFYLDRAQLYPGQSPRMSMQVLERVISSYLQTPQPKYVFSWQGGEPTLMGQDFFEQAVALQKKHAQPGAVIANGLQTNGALIDDGFADFLARHHFLLGVSLDGPAAIHDHFRLHPDGSGSYADVMRGISCLERQKVPFNILTVVSQANVRHGQTVYRFLRDHGFIFHQYVECVEFDVRGEPLPYAVSGTEWGEFLCAVFDEWQQADVRRVSVRLFDAILARLVDRAHILCTLGPACGQYVVVEWNGDLYPCDFFVSSEQKIGQIMDQEWPEIFNAPALKKLARQKMEYHARCGQCPYVSLCHGDCLKNRFYGRPDPRQGSWLCAGWKMFFAHALPRLQALADEIMSARQVS